MKHIWGGHRNGSLQNHFQHDSSSAQNIKKHQTHENISKIFTLETKIFERSSDGHAWIDSGILIFLLVTNYAARFVQIHQNYSYNICIKRSEVKFEVYLMVDRVFTRSIYIRNKCIPFSTPYECLLRHLT